jgi:hypothetical protein
MSRSPLLQHRLITTSGSQKQITLLRLFTGGALSCRYDCSQRADGLCDSRPVRPGLQFGESNPVRIWLCQRIDQKELVLLARLQTRDGNLQQVDHSERVDRDSGAPIGLCSGWRQHLDMERLTRHA